MIDNLTILTCSYNTPKILETMLKSFIKIHGETKCKLLISENSTNKETSKLLCENNIEFYEKKGSTHSEGVEFLLEKCNTKYALLVDSDIVFKKNIKPLLKLMKTNDLTLMGEVCGSRGGYNLKTRIHPWFCLINVENIKKHNIKFTDFNRIKETNSEAFYKNIPINNVSQGNSIAMYDVGSTFYEDIINKNLLVANVPNINDWFIHYEGSSWQRVSNHSGFVNLGNSVWNAFQKEIKEHENISIKNKFLHNDIDNSKTIAFIYPIFAPNDEKFEICYNSLTSFLFNDIPNIADLIIGGWCEKEEYWLKFKDLLSNYNVKFKIFDKNYGKAYIINDLSKNYLESNLHCKYFLSCDSDIILPISEVNILGRLEEVANNISTFGKKFSFFSLEQLEHCCHEHFRMNNKITISNEEIVWPNDGSGIAGGALFISTEFWKSVGGYRVMGVYSGDDGFLLLDSNKNGYFASIIKTVKVIHPKDSSTVYHNWKVNNIKKCTGKSTKDLDKDIDDANSFWKSK